MRRFYAILIIALAVDIILLPVLDLAAWFPRLTLALIPFVFLFAPPRASYAFFAVVTVFYWLTTSLNLGIIIFSLGLTMFFIRRIIPRFFHKDAWQTMIASSFGVLIFGAFLIVLSLIFAPGSIFVSPALIVSFILSAVVAVGANKLLKR